MLEDAVHRPCLSVPLAAEDQPEDEIAHDATILRAALGRDSLTQYQEIVSCGAPRRRAVSLPMKRKALPVATAAAISLAFVRTLPRHVGLRPRGLRAERRFSPSICTTIRTTWTTVRRRRPR